MSDYERERLEHFSAPLATPGLADQEVALEMGRECPERAWILSDRDVWYRNPFYQGPPVPPPEDW